ncbi:unnamed protein product [Owenia fusiformis]|uniref:Uncharacterized protein n=1 Tax=Owenia fusiformis TaxID=6347 RepID=A0A8J1TIH6_OWEFU|nr:unnamed protein product [Owenia fusiformis]
MAAKKVDIQSHIEDWAWNKFLKDPTRKERKLYDQQLVAMELDWKRVKFHDSPPVYDPEASAPGARTGVPTANVLFCTTFMNKTQDAQTYSFKSERTTRSSCTIEVENGYTMGMEMSVKLATPCEIFEANAGFNREMTLTNYEGQTIEEELTWGVDSQIKVPARTTAEAKLMILEEKYEGKFTVTTTIKGRVRAIFTNMKDNNSFMKVYEGNVDDIIKKARDSGKIKGEAVTVSKDDKCVVCRTQGQCKFKYGLKQTVEVDQTKL